MVGHTARMGDDGSTPSADGETMLAAQVVSTTGPEGVEVRQVPRPAPVAGEVLIDVHAVGVSFPDLLLSKGQYQLRPEPPFTLGGDCAGIVVADAGSFRAGQRVAAVMPRAGCRCRRTRSSRCRRRSIWSPPQACR
jgi:NADPH:quinone reductase-like Zn-dependent oxidoreductase